MGDQTIFRLLDNGRLGLGTTSPAERLDVAGDVRCVSLIQTSDARFKREVRELEDALETVLALRGVSYEWDREAFPAGEEGRQLGFLAQEVREVAPEAVQEADDGTLSVSYVALVPLLTEAVRDLERRCRELQADSLARDARQDAELKALAGRLQELESASTPSCSHVARSPLAGTAR